MEKLRSEVWNYCEFSMCSCGRANPALLPLTWCTDERASALAVCWDLYMVLEPDVHCWGLVVDLAADDSFSTLR